MSNYRHTILLSLLALGLLLITVAPANATTQWSRKYGVSCNTCHTIFPRLNSYGEMFLKNGYQDPDAAQPDGATKGKTSLNDDAQIDKVDNFLGLRLNLTPFKMTTKDMRVELGSDRKDEYETRFTFGNTDWFQVFYAGSINKNLSIFIEAESAQTGFKFNWFYMGFHHIVGDLVNFQIGNISPVEFASYPDRLPQLPAAPKSKAFSIKTSGGGAPEDAVDMRSARHGLQWYGWQGPVTVWAGFAPGGNPTGVNANNTLGYWVGGRYDIPETMGALAGSNATLWFMGGTDASNTGGNAPGDSLQHTNGFTRISPQFNLRMENVDIQFAYALGSEDNYALVHPDSVKTDFSFNGITLVAGYLMGKWFPTVQFDQFSAKIADKDAPAMKSTMLTPAITYLWKENVRYSIYADLDMRSEVKAGDATADKPTYTPKNSVYVNIRVMI